MNRGGKKVISFIENRKVKTDVTLIHIGGIFSIANRDSN